MWSLANIRASENGKMQRSETFEVSPILYYRAILGLKMNDWLNTHQRAIRLNFEYYTWRSALDCMAVTKLRLLTICSFSEESITSHWKSKVNREKDIHRGLKWTKRIDKLMKSLIQIIIPTAPQLRWITTTTLVRLFSQIELVTYNQI
jgi:hypothetical protein